MKNSPGPTTLVQERLCEILAMLLVAMLMNRNWF